MRVPVLSLTGVPLTPTKPSRARRWLEEGKAVAKWSRKLTVFYVQLTTRESDRKFPDIVVGIDPGKMFSGFAVVSNKDTLLTAHVELPFKNVTKRMTQRAMMRRTRRSRRINRKLPFDKRSHRQKRFNNRKQKGLPPSIKANKILELQILKQINKLYPISNVVVEVVKAKGDKGFSPVMCGQKLFLSKISRKQNPFNRLKKPFTVSTVEGWVTSQTRKHLKLAKEKGNKSLKIPQTHANDGIALAAIHFVKFVPHRNDCYNWWGEVHLTDTIFLTIARVPICRRQLHLLQFSKGENRRKYGGTVTRHGFRKGDYVEAVKAGKVYRGWVSGDTKTCVAVNDANWKQGQYAASKVKLIHRSTGLVVTSQKYKVHGD